MGKRPSVSMKDVAALAQVSVGTISNVLNKPELVAPDTRRRVLEAIEKLVGIEDLAKFTPSP